jgi:hypothetical protein
MCKKLSPAPVGQSAQTQTQTLETRRKGGMREKAKIARIAETVKIEKTKTLKHRRNGGRGGLWKLPKIAKTAKSAGI